MTDGEKRDEAVYTYHRPISITVTLVELMPAVRDLPQETLMTVNLRLGLKAQERLFDILRDNLGKAEPDRMIALTIRGVS